MVLHESWNMQQVIKNPIFKGHEDGKNRLSRNVGQEVYRPAPCKIENEPRCEGRELK